MKKYEYMAHTSDEQFRAYGKNLEEAFINAAYAMANIITDHTKVQSNIEEEFSIEAENNESLLYDFLEKFLYYVDAEGLLLHKIKDLTIRNNSLHTHFVGDNNINNYDINTHIKAITYQNMFIKDENGKITIQAVVDI